MTISKKSDCSSTKAKKASKKVTDKLVLRPEDVDWEDLKGVKIYI